MKITFVNLVHNLKVAVYARQVRAGADIYINKNKAKKIRKALCSRACDSCSEYDGPIQGAYHGKHRLFVFEYSDGSIEVKEIN